MSSPIISIQRALVVLALTSPALTRPLGAQTSRLHVADGGRFFASAGMRGFETRRQSGFGQFITDSTLRAASGVRLGFVVAQRMPTIIYGAGADDGEFPISSRVCAGGLACEAPRCYVRVFIDGTQVFDGTPRFRDAEGVDFSRLRTEDFSGIEFYAGAAGLPAQFAGRNAECGTFLMWSREP